MQISIQLNDATKKIPGGIIKENIEIILKTHAAYFFYDLTLIFTVRKYKKSFKKPARQRMVRFVVFVNLSICVLLFSNKDRHSNCFILYLLDFIFVTNTITFAWVERRYTYQRNIGRGA